METAGWETTARAYCLNFGFIKIRVGFNTINLTKKEKLVFTEEDIKTAVISGKFINVDNKKEFKFGFIEVETSLSKSTSDAKLLGLIKKQKSGAKISVDDKHQNQISKGDIDIDEIHTIDVINNHKIGFNINKRANAGCFSFGLFVGYPSKISVSLNQIIKTGMLDRNAVYFITNCLAGKKIVYYKQIIKIDNIELVQAFKALKGLN